MDEIFSSYRFCCPLFLKEHLREPGLNRDYQAILTKHTEALISLQLDVHAKTNKETSEELQTALFFSVIVTIIGMKKLDTFIHSPYYDILKKIDEKTYVNIIEKAKEDEHYKNATPLNTIIKTVQLNTDVKEMVDEFERSYNSIRVEKSESIIQ